MIGRGRRTVLTVSPGPRALPALAVLLLLAACGGQPPPNTGRYAAFDPRPTLYTHPPAAKAAPGDTQAVNGQAVKTETARTEAVKARPEKTVRPNRERQEAARPRRPAVQPDDLLGIGRAQLQGLLGEPALLRRESPAEIWQYRSAACVLDVVLYPRDGAVEVVHLEAREREAAKDVAVSACLAQLLAGPRAS